MIETFFHFSSFPFITYFYDTNGQHYCRNKEENASNNAGCYSPGTFNSIARSYSMTNQFNFRPDVKSINGF